MKCKKCGASQEVQFSWDGKCLVCEEEGDDSPNSPPDLGDLSFEDWCDAYQNSNP